ncbi:MAG: ABC transporter ATP-binding protein [Candidatus Poseidoniaceae archaeon]|nr:ABC transporter ATP-binding protein [Candidatus Poseidoniaceae archaeon]
MLIVKDLKKGFGSGGSRTEVLKGIDFTMTKGELVALMGSSGSGKSTLLNIVGGLLSAEAGLVNLAGTKYGTKRVVNLVDVRRNNVGWIFQSANLLEHLTAKDNVAFALTLAGAPIDEARRRAVVALEKVGLAERVDFFPSHLSGGQAQRVAIARAIVSERPLLLADEPTGNLDTKTGEDIFKLFQELCHDVENPISILMVTHDPILAAKADRMLLLRNGVVTDSTAEHAWEEE